MSKEETSTGVYNHANGTNTTTTTTASKPLPTYYLLLDLLTKLIAAAALLGIMIILIMSASDAKKDRSVITSLAAAVEKLQYDLASWGSSTSPFYIRYSETTTPMKVQVGIDTNGGNPVYIREAPAI